eukprot:1161206-Pelagomonas_calceolata.AAC.2
MRVWWVACHAPGRPEAPWKYIYGSSLILGFGLQPGGLIAQPAGKERKGKGYIAVPAYEGSLAEA